MQDHWQSIALQAQQQNSTALLRLLEEFENVIHAACRRFTVPFCEQGDLLQEAYVGFLKAVQTFDPTRGSTFAHFAKTKTQEAAWQYIRVRNRNRQREMTESLTTGEDGDTGLSLWEQLPDTGSSEPFCELEWRSLLQGLSEREALAVERIVIDGLSMADLARLEGVSPGTVKTWKQRAFLKIREELKKTRG
ncbi:MAG: RNA polymerase sigma factor [Tumebacillaceae bacterium]